MTYWRSRQWQLCFCRRTLPRWKSVQSRRHSNLHHQARFPWTGTASTGMEKSFTEFKKLERKGKTVWKVTTCKPRQNNQTSLHAMIPGLVASHRCLWNREISGLCGMQERYLCGGAPVLPHCLQRKSERKAKRGNLLTFSSIFSAFWITTLSELGVHLWDIEHQNVISPAGNMCLKAISISPCRHTFIFLSFIS